MRRAKHSLPRAKPPRLPVLELKALVRHRDGYRCTECGVSAREHVRRTGKTLEVHRVVPGSRYTVKGCVTLCRKCHDKMPKSPPGTSPLWETHVIIHVPPEMREALRLLAVRNFRTVPSLIRAYLARHLQEEGLWPPRKQGLPPDQPPETPS